MRHIYLTLILAIIAGCAQPHKADYNTSLIRSWQERQAATEDMAEIAGKGSSEQYVRHVVQDVLNANRPVHWRHDDDGDYWRTMQQTVANDYKGDCEDISIYWYILLRRTGAISDSSLSLRIVHLPGYPEKELHTVCVIRTDGATLVIDNGILCNDGPRFGEIILECDLFSIFS